MWLVVAVAVARRPGRGCLLLVKGRKIPGEHVFRASRFSRGNLWFPTQVAVTPASVVHYTPELVGGREHSMHISHIASVLDRSQPVFLGRADRELGRHEPGARATDTGRRTRWR